jgi:hypothetical protein
MMKWLWERRLALVLIGVIVPPLIAPNLWREIQSDWRFWLPYSVALFAAAVLILSRTVDSVWSRLHKG